MINNTSDFVNFLRGIKTGDTKPEGDGGYLIPEYTQTRRKDIRGRIWLIIGRLFRNPAWKAKGHKQVKTIDYLTAHKVLFAKTIVRNG